MPDVRRMVRPLVLGPLLLAAAAGAAGCGEDTTKPTVKALTPEDQVKVIVESFGRATTNKDYSLICERLIARSLSDNVEQFGLPCEKAFAKGLGDVKNAQLRIEDITVRGGVAYAKVHSTAIGQAASDDTLKLQRLGGQWRIVSLDDPGDRTTATPRFTFF